MPYFVISLIAAWIFCETVKSQKPCPQSNDIFVTGEGDIDEICEILTKIKKEAEEECACSNPATSTEVTTATSQCTTTVNSVTNIPPVDSSLTTSSTQVSDFTSRNVISPSTTDMTTAIELTASTIHAQENLPTTTPPLSGTTTSSIAAPMQNISTNTIGTESLWTTRSTLPDANSNATPTATKRDLTSDTTITDQNPTVANTEWTTTQAVTSEHTTRKSVTSISSDSGTSSTMQDAFGGHAISTQSSTITESIRTNGPPTAKHTTVTTPIITKPAAGITTASSTEVDGLVTIGRPASTARTSTAPSRVESETTLTASQSTFVDQSDSTKIAATTVSSTTAVGSTTNRHTSMISTSLSPTVKVSEPTSEQQGTNVADPFASTQNAMASASSTAVQVGSTATDVMNGISLTSATVSTSTNSIIRTSTQAESSQSALSATTNAAETHAVVGSTVSDAALETSSEVVTFTNKDSATAEIYETSTSSVASISSIVDFATSDSWTPSVESTEGFASTQLLFGFVSKIFTAPSTATTEAAGTKGADFETIDSVTDSATETSSVPISAFAYSEIPSVYGTTNAYKQTTFEQESTNDNSIRSQTISAITTVDPPDASTNELGESTDRNVRDRISTKVPFSRQRTFSFKVTSNMIHDSDDSTAMSHESTSDIVVGFVTSAGATTDATNKSTSKFASDATTQYVTDTTKQELTGKIDEVRTSATATIRQSFSTIDSEPEPTELRISTTAAPLMDATSTMLITEPEETTLQLKHSGPVFENCTNNRSGAYFWISSPSKNKMTFDTAKDVCANCGSFPAVIPDKATYDELARSIRRVFAVTILVTVWSGTTVNGTEISPSYAYAEWAEGHPKSGRSNVAILVSSNALTMSYAPSHLTDGVVCWRTTS